MMQSDKSNIDPIPKNLSIISLEEIITQKYVDDNQYHSNVKSITSVSFSPDGKYIATGSADNFLRVYEITPENELKLKEEQWFGTLGSVNSVSFSPDGNYLAAGFFNELRINKITSENKLNYVTSQLHNGVIKGISFSPDGKRIFTASGDSNAKFEVFNTSSKNEFVLEEQIIRGYEDFLGFGVDFSPDGKHIAIASSDFEHDNGYLRINEITPKNELKEIMVQKQDDLVTDVSFSPNGKYLALSSYKKKEFGSQIPARGHLRINEITPKHELKEIMVQNYNGELILGVDFSPDGKYLATGSSISSYNKVHGCLRVFKIKYD